MAEGLLAGKGNTGEGSRLAKNNKGIQKRPG